MILLFHLIIYNLIKKKSIMYFLYLLTHFWFFFLMTLAIMKFFSNKPSEKWNFNEVCNYYRSKDKDNKSLGEILFKIKRDLEHFNIDSYLHKKNKYS